MEQQPRFKRTSGEKEMGLSVYMCKKLRDKHKVEDASTVYKKVPKEVVPKEVVSEEIVDQNTVSEGKPEDISKGKRYVRKKWCFTMFNPDENDIEMLDQFLVSSCEVAGYQGERTKSGKRHIQGFFITKVKRRFTSFNLKPGTHFELMRGTIPDNVAYVTKEESFDKEWNLRLLHNCTVEAPVETIKEEDFFNWQKEVLSIVKQKPDDRIIYWKYDSGGTGKSALIKYLCVHLDAIVLSGSSKDIKYGIVKYKELKGYYPSIICIDLPRALSVKWNTDKVSFAGIEEVKNGCFFSPKYESASVVFNAPHVLIFSNVYPNTDLYTEDRWHIRRITLSKEEREAIKKYRESRLNLNMEVNEKVPLVSKQLEIQD